MRYTEINDNNNVYLLDEDNNKIAMIKRYNDGYYNAFIPYNGENWASMGLSELKDLDYMKGCILLELLDKSKRSDKELRQQLLDNANQRKLIREMLEKDFPVVYHS